MTYVSTIKEQGKISAGELFAALKSGREIAVLDVRSNTEFLAGHIVRSVPLPLGRIESDIGRLVPRKSAAIVVVGGGGGLASRAVARIRELGFVDVAELDGGIEGWRSAGRPVITGQHALSKALGEFVEREYHTPRLTAEELQRRRDAGEKIVVIDTRPTDEFEYIAIPDSVAAPGAELLYRFDEIVASPDTTVVVTCAGRTRGIIGAQALLNAGVTNPVYSLENGTSGWEFAGYDLWRGADRVAPAPRPQALARAEARAVEVERRFGIRGIDAVALAAFRADAARSLYLYDVRTSEEYLGGHLPGSLSAPGGQLVQTTDLFVGVNNGRIVVIDSADGARGAITASWLVQLGIGEVFLYRAPPSELTEVGEPQPSLPDLAHGRYVDADDVRALIDRGDLTIVDFAAPLSGFSPRNVPDNSWFATRASLPTSADQLPGKGPVLFLSRDGVEAAWAANDIAAAAGRQILVLRGGNRVWEAAGLPVVDAAHEHSLDAGGPPNPQRSIEQRKQFFADYVAWGDTIVAEIRADGTLDLGGRA